MRLYSHLRFPFLYFPILLLWLQQASHCSAKPLTSRQRHPALLLERQNQDSQPTLDPVSPSNILNISSVPTGTDIWLDTNPNLYYPFLPAPEFTADSSGLQPLPIPANWSLYCPDPILNLCDLVISPDTALPMAPKDKWVHIKNKDGGCEFSAWVPDEDVQKDTKECRDTGAQMVTAVVEAAGNGTQGPEAGLVNRASINVQNFDGWAEGTGSQVDSEKWSLVLEATSLN